MIHAEAASGWSLSGSILTFAMPMLLFIIAATVLYLLFTRPHQVPGHRLLAPAQAAPDAGSARATATPTEAAATDENPARQDAAVGESPAGQDATVGESPAGQDAAAEESPAGQDADAPDARPGDAE